MNITSREEKLEWLNALLEDAIDAEQKAILEDNVSLTGQETWWRVKQTQNRVDNLKRDIYLLNKEDNNDS